jgi:hypothetical protein
MTMNDGPKIGVSLRANRIPQAAIAYFSDTTTFSLSLYIRGIAEMPPAAAERVQLATEAAIAVADESPVPISWADPAKLKALVLAKVAELRGSEAGCSC